MGKGGFMGRGESEVIGVSLGVRVITGLWVV